MTRTLAALALSALTLTACDSAAPGSDAPASAAAVASPIAASVAAGPLAGLSGPDLSDLEAAGDTYVAFVKGNKLGRLTAAVEGAGGAVTFSHEPTGFAVVQGISEAAAADLAASGYVDDIQADVLFEMELPEPVGAPEVAQVNSPSNPAGASRFPSQWNMQAVGADAAWAAGKLGSADVTVAILDTGIDYLYPDLQGRVDLSRSVSFVPIDDLYAAYYFPTRHPVTDLGYHGTHVAATVASNGYVAAGVTSQTTLMGVKVCSVVEGGCPGAAVFAGLLHAADNGADVINMSLGGSFTKRDYPGYVGYLNKIFSYISRQGSLVVVSAGNDAIDLDHDGNSFKTYCNVPGVACVSATGPTAGGTYTTGPWTEADAPASYTNYGRSAVNVAAPGGNDGAAVIAACSSSSLAIPACQTGTYVLGLSGTSMAAPHVAGLASLLAAEGYRSSRIITRMQQSADDLGQRGTDPYYGKGRINVARALGVGGA